MHCDTHCVVDELHNREDTTPHPLDCVASVLGPSDLSRAYLFGGEMLSRSTSILTKQVHGFKAGCRGLAAFI
jgi:hypothetical protein